MTRKTELLALAAVALVLTPLSHAAAVVLVTWRTLARHRGRGHGTRVRDHLPPYMYRPRKIV